MYGEQQDDSTFALDPRVLLALAGGAVAGGIGKKYATKELGKGFEAAHARELAGVKRGLSSKTEAREKLMRALNGLEKDAGLGEHWGRSSIAEREALAAGNPAYKAKNAEFLAAERAAADAETAAPLAFEEAADRLAGKKEWVNEMGLAVGGVPAAMLGYGIGSGVMRKKDGQDAYRNPLQ